MGALQGFPGAMGEFTGARAKLTMGDAAADGGGVGLWVEEKIPAGDGIAPKVFG